jgi:hypothetical protein
VDPVPAHYFSDNLVSQGTEPGTTGSVARNSDHQTRESLRDKSNRSNPIIM